VHLNPLSSDRGVYKIIDDASTELYYRYDVIRRMRGISIVMTLWRWVNDL